MNHIMTPTTLPHFPTIIESTITVYINKLPPNLQPRGRALFMKDLTIWLESQEFRLSHDPSPTRHITPRSPQP